MDYKERTYAYRWNMLLCISSIILLAIITLTSPTNTTPINFTSYIAFIQSLSFNNIGLIIVFILATFLLSHKMYISHNSYISYKLLYKYKNHIETISIENFTIDALDMGWIHGILHTFRHHHTSLTSEESNKTMKKFISNKDHLQHVVTNPSIFTNICNKDQYQSAKNMLDSDLNRQWEQFKSDVLNLINYEMNVSSKGYRLPEEAIISPELPTLSLDPLLASMDGFNTYCAENNINVSQ